MLHVPSHVNHHTDLDRLAIDAAAKDKDSFVTSVHEAGHSLMHIATGAGVQEAALEFKDGRLTGGYAIPVEFVKEDFNFVESQIAGYVAERMLCGKIIPMEKSREGACGDARKVKLRIGVDIWRDGNIAKRMFSLRQFFDGYRDSILCIALEIWNRKGEPLTGHEVNSLFVFGCNLP